MTVSDRRPSCVVSRPSCVVIGGHPPGHACHVHIRMASSSVVSRPSSVAPRRAVTFGRGSL